MDYTHYIAGNKNHWCKDYHFCITCYYLDISYLFLKVQDFFYPYHFKQKYIFIALPRTFTSWSSSAFPSDTKMRNCQNEPPSIFHQLIESGGRRYLFVSRRFDVIWSFSLTSKFEYFSFYGIDCRVSPEHQSRILRRWFECHNTLSFDCCFFSVNTLSSSSCLSISCGSISSNSINDYLWTWRFAFHGFIIKFLFHWIDPYPLLFHRIDPYSPILQNHFKRKALSISVTWNSLFQKSAW